MVRIIAGTLIQVGLGAYEPEDMSRFWKPATGRRQDRQLRARGLTLLGMRYPEYPGF